jgi:hypothetical protein
MQQMDHEERGHEWQYSYGGGYSGELHEPEHVLPGQKLESSGDREFADPQTRSVKQELQPASPIEYPILRHPQLFLGIISLAALILLFGLLVLGLFLGVNATAIGYGFLIACIVIVVVNGYYSRTNSGTQRQQTAALPDEKPAVISTPPPAVGKAVTITYRGHLAATAANMIMHWGYSNWRDGLTSYLGRMGWNGVTDTQMIRQKDGTWQANIIVPLGATSLNMTFCNQGNVWDNNNNSNYYLREQFMEQGTS